MNMEIVKIDYKFFRCAETHGRHSFIETVIPSTWKVKFSDGTIKTYNITLSPDKLDPDYDSRKDTNHPHSYYIQIDDNPKPADKKFKLPLSERSFDQDALDKDNRILCPKYGKGKPLCFYEISPKDFEEIPTKEFDNILDESEKIDLITQKSILKTKSIFSRFCGSKIDKSELENESPKTIERIKKLDLDEFESTLLFHDLFEKYLINYMQKKDPSIKDARINEKTNLIENNKSSSKKIIKVFFGMCCCKC